MVPEGLEAQGENMGVHPVVLGVGHLVGCLVECPVGPEVGLLEVWGVPADCSHPSGLLVVVPTGAGGKVEVVPQCGNCIH